MQYKTAVAAVFLGVAMAAPVPKHSGLLAAEGLAVHEQGGGGPPACVTCHGHPHSCAELGAMASLGGCASTCSIEVKEHFMDKTQCECSGDMSPGGTVTCSGSMGAYNPYEASLAVNAAGPDAEEVDAQHTGNGDETSTSDPYEAVAAQHIGDATDEQGADPYQEADAE